ncbi:hypothetical protein ACFIOY_26340 [Bradyrhizobium sp. TZ2]
MEISMRGWSRNMGTTKMADYDLSAMTASRDPTKSVHFGQSALFKSYGEVSVAWGQSLRFTGDYRVQIDFSRSDVVKLFKTMFGSVITIDMLEEYGLSISDDLKKKLLGEIKLADLTIGDLAGLGLASKKKNRQRTPLRRPSNRSSPKTLITTCRRGAFSGVAEALDPFLAYSARTRR